MDVGIRQSRHAIFLAATIALLHFGGELPATADVFIAPSQVRADVDGRFVYSWHYLVQDDSLAIAGSGWHNVANTTGASHGDCFCFPFCTKQPGDTLTFHVEGRLVNPNLIGRVRNWIAGCNRDPADPETKIVPFASNGVEDTPTAAVRFTSSPVPCHERAVFEYSLPEAGPVEIDVFDVSGRRVAALLEGWQDAGEHALAWNLVDSRGERLPRGIYLARLRFNGRARLLRIPAID